MSFSSIRVGGLAGLAFVGTVFTVNIIQAASHQPMAGASRAEVVEHYADAGVAAALGTALAPLAWLALLVFAGGVVAALRRHEQRSGDGWSLVGLVGAVMQNALFAGVVATQAAMATGSLSDDATWALWQLHNALFTLNAMSLAIVLLAVSVGAYRAGLIRGWQRTLGFVGAAAMTVAAVTTPVAIDGNPVGLIGFAGFLVWLVWLGSVSVRLLRVSAPAPAAETTEATLVGTH
jgi:hypothetical protein